jgi:hypothetical protein
MQLQEQWHQDDSESFQLSILAIGQLMQQELNVETLEQLDWLAKGAGLHPASALMDPAWHIYVLGAAWAKHKYPKAGKDGWQAFGSLISELAAGRIWGDTDSERWQEVGERAKGIVNGDRRDDTIQVFRQLEKFFFSKVS